MAIDIKKFVIRFIEEARDHINRLNDGLAALESGSADKESINAIFRFRAIKSNRAANLRAASFVSRANRKSVHRLFRSAFAMAGRVGCRTGADFDHDGEDRVQAPIP